MTPMNKVEGPLSKRFAPKALYWWIGVAQAHRKSQRYDVSLRLLLLGVSKVHRVI